MRNLLAGLAFVLLATTSAACASIDDDSQSQPPSADQDLTTARNQDVQVLKVYDAPSFSISKGSIYSQIDQESCKPEGKAWSEIKAWDTLTSGYLSVSLDCTDAFAAKYGFPSMRAVSLVGSRTKRAEESYYGYVGFSNSGGGYWVKTVELAVKQSVIDAATFNGIGFYLNSFSYRYYEAKPAAGPDNGNGHFMNAAQVRAQANQYPEAVLPSGEKARIVKVLLPSAYALGGTSYVPAFYFRPFAEYVDATGEKHQRWDSVAGDYFVGSSTSFDREGDVLAR